MATDDIVPGWLGWIVPIVTGLGVLVVIVRKLLTQAVREDFQKMLDEKHSENSAKFLYVDQQLTKMNSELSRIAQDVAYLSGAAGRRSQ